MNIIKKIVGFYKEQQQKNREENIRLLEGKGFEIEEMNKWSNEELKDTVTSLYH